MNTDSTRWDWRKRNQEAGLTQAGECAHCCGMGRVATGTSYVGSFYFANYGTCPVCKGSGKEEAHDAA